VGYTNLRHHWAIPLTSSQPPGNLASGLPEVVNPVSRSIIAVYTKNNTNPVNTSRMHNTDLLNVETIGKCKNHSDLNLYSSGHTSEFIDKG
jgi:hypothetical protein